MKISRIRENKTENKMYEAMCDLFFVFVDISKAPLKKAYA